MLKFQSNSRERKKFHSGNKEYIKEVLEGCENKLLEVKPLSYIFITFYLET